MTTVMLKTLAMMVVHNLFANIENTTDKSSYLDCENYWKSTLNNGSTTLKVSPNTIYALHRKGYLIYNYKNMSYSSYSVSGKMPDFFGKEGDKYLNFLQLLAYLPEPLYQDTKLLYQAFNKSIIENREDKVLAA